MTKGNTVNIHLTPFLKQKLQELGGWGGMTKYMITALEEKIERDEKKALRYKKGQ